MLELDTQKSTPIRKEILTITENREIEYLLLEHNSNLFHVLRCIYSFKIQDSNIKIILAPNSTKEDFSFIIKEGKNTLVRPLEKTFTLLIPIVNPSLENLVFRMTYTYE